MHLAVSFTVTLVPNPPAAVVTEQEVPQVQGGLLHIR
jgi:hypothetical protein